MRVLIAGGGEVAALVARRLALEGNEVVLVEQNADRCSELEAVLDARVQQGSATSIRTMREAGVKDADLLIAVTDDDKVNLLTCLIAQAESSSITKVARVRTHEMHAWQQVCATAGLRIDHIIHPESEMVRRMLPVLGLPGVSDILDFAGGEIKVFGLILEPDHWAVGKTMEELDRAGPPVNSLIAMIFRGSQVIIPHGSDILREGDHVFIITRRVDLEEDFRFMGIKPQRSIARVFILGGKQVGIQIASDLEAEGVSVKLFERNLERCEKISRLLRKTIVVHGDGTDEATLVDEHIEGADAFLALTNDDEDNIIASLLARRLGVKKVVALVNRLNYLPMAQRLGISTTVSPRVAAVDSILRYVRKGRVQSVTTFRQEEAEAIELVATAGSQYVGCPLRKLKLPEGCIVGAIARPSGETLVPRGSAQIEVGDRVIFFALEHVVPKLEQMFLADRGKGRF